VAAVLSAADVTPATPATPATGGLWDFGTPALGGSGTSAALAAGALAAGVPPDAQGRVLLGTFTLHGLAPGAVALGAADPNPAIGFDTSSFAAGAGGAPLINDDPLIAAATATLTVSPVPEPAGVLAAGAAAAGLACTVRRSRRARAAGPANSRLPM
jgi:hypothetical protein